MRICILWTWIDDHPYELWAAQVLTMVHIVSDKQFGVDQYHFYHIETVIFDGSVHMFFLCKPI